MEARKNSDQRLAEWYDRVLASSGLACESRFVETPRGRTHLLAIGPADAPPVVLVPGVGTNAAALWLATMKALAPTHRAYALDIPGHPGRSARQPIPADGPAYAEWLGGVLDALGHKDAVFVGASLGSYIIVKLAAAAPSKVAGAVLSAPGGIVPVSKRGLLRLLPFLMLNRMFPSRERVRQIMRRMISFGAPISDDLLDLMEISFEPGRIADDQFTLKGVPPEELKSFHSPTLVIAGRHDVLFPAGALLEQTPVTLPHAQIKVIEGMNHIPGPDDVATMNAMLLEFLGAMKRKAVTA